MVQSCRPVANNQNYQNAQPAFVSLFIDKLAMYFGNSSHSQQENVVMHEPLVFGNKLRMSKVKVGGEGRTKIARTCCMHVFIVFL